MKSVTINNNWVKISDLIEKDSIIQVGEGSEINLTDNITNDPVKFSIYKVMENFTAGKKSSFWVRSNSINSVLNIFNLKIIGNSELGGGFPAGNTSYENIGEIETDIKKLNEKVKIFKVDIEE